jgi:hypothetical protein
MCHSLLLRKAEIKKEAPKEPPQEDVERKDLSPRLGPETNPGLGGSSEGPPCFSFGQKEKRATRSGSPLKKPSHSEAYGRGQCRLKTGIGLFSQEPDAGIDRWGGPGAPRGATMFLALGV